MSEVSCHPGHVEPRADARYNREREVELRTLLDPRVRAAVDRPEVALINYTAYRPPVGRDRRTAMPALRNGGGAPADSLDVDALHHGLGIARPGGGAGRHRLPDAGDVGRAQPDVEGAEVLV